jgi:hypothetical protein
MKEFTDDLNAGRLALEPEPELGFGSEVFELLCFLRLKAWSDWAQVHKRQEIQRQRAWNKGLERPLGVDFHVIQSIGLIKTNHLTVKRIRQQREVDLMY